MEPTTSYGASPQKVSQQQEAGPSRVSIVKDSIAAHSPRKNNTQEDEEGMIDSLSPPKAASDQNSRGPSENRANVVPSKPRENYCIPCELQLNNSVAYKQHLLGLRHAKRVEDLGDQSSQSDPIDTALGELQSARLVSSLQRETNPIIGLDCLTERVCISRPNEDPTYYCDLCDAEFELRDALHHVTNTQHRFLFLKATRASLISELIDGNGELVSSESAQSLRAKLSGASAKLESEIGRGAPKITRVASNTLSNRWSAQKNHPRVATVAPNSRPYNNNHFSEGEAAHFRRRRNHPYDSAGQMGGSGMGRGGFLNDSHNRFNGPPDDRLRRPGRYLDVDTPQGGERDYSMPTAAHRLLPGEQPDERSLRARTRSPTSQLGSNRELKRRRMGPPRFPSRMDIEEGEDTEDYDSMLDQYRQEKQEEWARRNTHRGGGGANGGSAAAVRGSSGGDSIAEREMSPPPREEIFFQKYVREMHKEWEKWYEEKKQKEDTEGGGANEKGKGKEKEKDNEKEKPKEKEGSASGTTSKKASNLKECKSILAQCRIKDESDAETAIEISRALAEAHVQYRLRYMKPEEKTKETQDIYKTVLGYLREMQSGKVPTLVTPNMQQMPPNPIMNPQMFPPGVVMPPNMMPPGFQMPPNAQYAPNMMYGSMPHPTPVSGAGGTHSWPVPTDPRTGRPMQSDWTNMSANGQQKNEGTNPLMMSNISSSDSKQQQQHSNVMQPTPYAQQASFYQGPPPVNPAQQRTNAPAVASS